MLRLIIAMTLLTACSSQFKVGTVASRSAATASPEPSADFSVTAPDSIQLGKTVNVSWTSVENADFYNLVVASDESCKNQVLAIERIEVLKSSFSMQLPGTYYICVFVSSKGELTRANDKAHKFDVISSNPVVILVSSDLANGTYPSTTIIDIKIQFSQKVIVTGIPKLKLETSTFDQEATYTSGSGSDTLVFEYTVQNGDNADPLDAHDSDDQINLYGGSIKSETGVSAKLNVPTGSEEGSLATEKAIVVDTSAPSIANATLVASGATSTSITISWQAAADNISSSLLYQLVYSTSDNISTANQALTNGTAVGSFSSSLTGNITNLSPGVPYYFNVVVKDEVGNLAAYSRATETLVNNAPTITLTEPNGTGDNIPVGSTSYTITYTDADSDDDATITLYYRTSNADCSASGIGNWTQIVTGLSENATSSYAWNPSALAAGSYYVCAKIDDDVNSAVYAVSPGALKLNTAPTISAGEPTGGNDTVGQTGSFSITWTDSDSDDNAAISLYYKASSGGACSTGTLITSALTEDANGTSGTYSWSLAAVAAGSYYVCYSISDGVNSAVETWSSGALVVNEKPTFSFVEPAAKAYVLAGGDLSIEWTATDSDNDASITLKYYNNSANCASSGTVIASGISEDSGPVTHTWNTTSIASGVYYICGLISDSINSVQTKITTATVAVYRNCAWTGSSSSSWTTAGNWSSCNGVSPTSVDRIVIPTGTPNQLVLTGSRSFAGFGEGTGGGTLKIDENSTLGFADYTIGGASSSVTIEGASSTCTTCVVNYTIGGYFRIVNGATVTLKPGINFSIGQYGSRINVGNSASEGHLVIAGGASEDEWISMSGPTDSSPIVVEGTSSARSSVNINGLKLSSYNLSHGMTFVNHYQIEQMSNIQMTPRATRLYDSMAYISLSNCANAAFDTLNWNNLTFATPTISSSRNVNASNSCSGIGPISISGNGPAYGSIFESDPNSVINWTVDSTSYNCVWTGGGGNSNWGNAANWSSCANGRGGYPDQFDWAIIPDSASSIGGNQPVLEKTFAIQGFFAGTGGGLLTIGSAKDLIVLSSSNHIQSNLKLRSSPSNCTDCQVHIASGTITIKNDKTLELQKAVKLRLPDSTSLTLGDGTTAGHLVTVTGTDDSNEWPVVSSTVYYNKGITLNGASGALSSISIDGLKIANVGHHNTSYIGLNLVNYYNVLKVDRLAFTVAYNGPLQGHYIRIRNCANSIFTDLQWTSIDFIHALDSTTGKNISISGCSSLGIGALDVSSFTGGSNLGYGVLGADDADGIIDWQ